MIPLTKPFVSRREIDYVSNAVLRAELGVGEYISKFERLWSLQNGYAHGVSCGSGSAALYIALRALGVGPGDKVIVPDFTSIACAAAVSLCGASPVFVDCDPLTLNADYAMFKEAMTVNRPKAVMLVAIYGRPVPTKLFELADHMQIPVIEDLAEAHGIKPRGDIVCYSFYGNKILTTGEGGMCLTQDPDLAQEMRDCANFYFDKDRTNTHRKLGWNFRMTNLQAAIGLAQVEKIDEILAKRSQVMNWYEKYLPVSFIREPREVGWLYDVTVPDVGFFKRKLDQANIASRYFFKPLRMQPPYAETLAAAHTCGRADDAYLHGLLLPLFPDLQEEQVKYVCEVLTS